MASSHNLRFGYRSAVNVEEPESNVPVPKLVTPSLKSYRSSGRIQYRTIIDDRQIGCRRRKETEDEAQTPVVAEELWHELDNDRWYSGASPQ